MPAGPVRTSVARERRAVEREPPVQPELQAQVDAQLAEVKSRSGTAGKAAGELREGTRVLREELDRKNK